MSATIVVGVDGSQESKAALRFAYAEAKLRRSSLRVVHAWLHDIGGLQTYYTGALGGKLGDRASLRAQRKEEWLGDLVRNVIGRADQVEVSRSVVEGNPAEVLVEAAREAELLVLGSRGYGGVTGMLLGSVSRRCAHEAPCPVVIVRGFGQRRGGLRTTSRTEAEPARRRTAAPPAVKT